MRQFKAVLLLLCLAIQCLYCSYENDFSYWSSANNLVEPTAIEASPYEQYRYLNREYNTESSYGEGCCEEADSKIDNLLVSTFLFQNILLIHCAVDVKCH